MWPSIFGSMQTSDFDYFLPKELIAQSSVEPRDHSRLMVVDKNQQTVEHRYFFNIVDYLQPGDLLVWNTSKVFKARLQGKIENGKSVEIFLVKPLLKHGMWQALAKPGRALKPGIHIVITSDFTCKVTQKNANGTIEIQFEDEEVTVREKANRYGHIPVPPYVKDEPEKLEAYQTVYAKQEGSVAAPTAGFHFTPELIEKIKMKGVEFAEVTLHVGLGTFLPVKSERIEDHVVDSEWVALTAGNAEKINRAKREGRRVIAVGTTTVRTLEGIASNGTLHPYRGEINMFITPGFTFHIIDALITNFHLPKSTLLMLVSAFVGDRAFVLQCYKKAVDERYRFFSFGDAMFIHS